MRRARGLRGFQGGLFLISLSGLMALSVPGTARAGFSTSLVTNEVSLGNGLTRYTYTLTNSLQSTISAYAFSLAVDAGANLESIMEPAGWASDYTVGATTIEWSTGSPLTPGNSAIFSFESAESPSSSAYQATGFDPSTILFYTNPGTAPTPGASAVPEPASMALMAMGGLIAVAYTQLQRRNAGGSFSRTVATMPQVLPG